MGPRIALVFALGALVGLLALVGARPGSLDDAFVVLRHARHLAEHGAFAPGPAGPPVDGFTSLLDVVVKAVPLALGAPDALRAAGWVGLVGSALAAGGLAALAFRLSAPAGIFAAAALALALATAPGLAEGTSYVLETHLYALLLGGLAAAVVYTRPRLALALALIAPLVRPEGLALGPCAWWLASRGQGLRRRGLLALGAGYAALSAARWWAFGAPLPNSYYAKASDSRWYELLDGLRYLAAFVLRPEGAALCAALALAFGSRARGASTPRTPARDLALLTLTAVAAVAVSGGDSYHGARLLLPVTLWAWLAVAAALPGAARGARLAVCLAAAVSAGSALLPALRAPREALTALRSGPLGLDAYGDEARVVAAFERALAPALASGTPAPVAHRHAQRYAWFSQTLSFLDLTGLTDRDIARLPAPGPITFGRDALDEALARRAAVIHLDHLFARPELWAGRSVRAVLAPPDAAKFLGAPFPAPALVAALDAAYVTASLRGLYGGHLGVNVLVRRDLARDFAAAGFDLGD